MRIPMTKYDNTVVTVIIVPLTLSPLLYLLRLVRLDVYRDCEFVFSHGSLKSKVGHILDKDTLWQFYVSIYKLMGCLYLLDHTHPQFTLSNLPSPNLVSIFRCSSPPRTSVKLIQITWCILLEISFIVNEFIFQVLTYTGFLGELEHPKTKTRLINEMFESVMGEYVFFFFKVFFCCCLFAAE